VQSLLRFLVAPLIISASRRWPEKAENEHKPKEVGAADSHHVEEFVCFEGQSIARVAIRRVKQVLVAAVDEEENGFGD